MCVKPQGSTGQLTTLAFEPSLSHSLSLSLVYILVSPQLPPMSFVFKWEFPPDYVAGLRLTLEERMNSAGLSGVLGSVKIVDLHLGTEVLFFHFISSLQSSLSCMRCRHQLSRSQILRLALLKPDPLSSSPTVVMLVYHY